MLKAKRFESLKVFSDARDLVKIIYRLCSKGPLARDFALSDQLRRAAISIVSNISEGFERGGDKEFNRYLSMAKGSAGEIRAQLYLCFDLGYLPEEEVKVLIEKVEEISRQLFGLMRYVKRSGFEGTRFKQY